MRCGLLKENRFCQSTKNVFLCRAKASPRARVKTAAITRAKRQSSPCKMPWPQGAQKRVPPIFSKPAIQKRNSNSRPARKREGGRAGILNRNRGAAKGEGRHPLPRPAERRSNIKTANASEAANEKIGASGGELPIAQNCIDNFDIL